MAVLNSLFMSPKEYKIKYIQEAYFKYGLLTREEYITQMGRLDAPALQWSDNAEVHR